MSRPILTLLVALSLVLLGQLPGHAAEPAAAVSGVAVETLPALARESLPLITNLTATACPELPPAWVVAQVQAESGWNPGMHGDAAGGSAGLYQFGRRAWVAAGGAPWTADPPGDDSDVLATNAHLHVAIPWVCANLRAVMEHLSATGKPTAPLDAMLVCHIAGCGRVTGSRSGIPETGEAGCGERCAQLIRRYIVAVHDNVARFAIHDPAAEADTSKTAGAPVTGHPTPAAPDWTTTPHATAVLTPTTGRYTTTERGGTTAPAAWTGGATGCRPPDPTGDGCLSGAARHGLEAVGAAFGGWRGGPVVRDTGCWDQHAWNPRSDHAKGRACDFMVSRPGSFAMGAERENGWKVANWLRANAGPLHVKYVIWQGRYWDPHVRDDPGGWGRRYSGGGVYDVRSATGGHFDHVHASFEE